MTTRLLTLSETAELFRKTPQAFRWMRHQGEAPPAVKIGGRLYWREQDVEAHIAARLEEAP